MSYIVKNCPAYVKNGKYYDCWINQDTWCENIDSCIMKKIIKNLETVINGELCYNCDGCGYDNGCEDTDCGMYQAQKSLELLKIEDIEEK